MRIKIRTLLILTILGAFSAMGFVYLGLYNISATDQHTSPVYKLLEYAMRKSVQFRTGSIDVPDLSDRQRISSGMAHYRSHCVQCHGAPGVAPEPFSFGLLPAPANMVAAAREWEPAELYWIIRHGIKMSGMPAWEYRFSDNEIWDVVAFVKHMPRLSVAEYRKMSQEASRDRSREVSREASRKAVHAPSDDVQAVSGLAGDAKAGKKALQQYLCVTCHQIPGVTGANRHVGPPLNGMAGRKYIGGIIPNTPENMVRWLQNPQQFDPMSAMPNLAVTDKDARDIAAFLYTLEDID
jgi:mono/diheme cytochrome c family protein